MAALDELGLSTEIWTDAGRDRGADPLRLDQQHVAYDADQVHRFWLALVQMNRVFEVFRSRFIGKCSPVHLFWGALDLAVTRFSGRPAPTSRRRAELRPTCHVGGLLPRSQQRRILAGPDGEGVFYSYAYPEPPGYRDAPVSPAPASFDEAMGEFTLPYTAVREAADPDAVLLEFLQSTYDAAADTGNWDRPALERHS